MLSRAARRQSKIILGGNNNGFLSLAGAKNTRLSIKATYISDHDDGFDWKFEEDNKEEESLYKTTDSRSQGKPKGEDQQVERQWTTLYNYLGGDTFYKSDPYPANETIDWPAFEDAFMSTSTSMHQYSESSRKSIADFRGGVLKGTLLSYVCCRQPPASVIRMLIQASPETLVLSNSESFTPLLYIFEEIMHQLEDIHSDTSTDEYDLRWDDVMTFLELVKDHTHYTSELLQMTRGEAENTIIHHLMIIDSTPLFVVKDFLSTYPDSVLLRNANGATPLHLAAQQNMSPEIVSALLKKDKGKATLTITDAKGCTPLHLACIHGVTVDILHSTSDDISRSVIEMLLYEDYNKEALNMKDNLNRTPLMHAIMNGLSTDVVSLLLEASSEETVEKLLRIIIGMPLRERRVHGSDLPGFRETNSSKSGQSYDHFFESQIQDVSLRYFPCLAVEISANRHYQLLLSSRASDRIFTAIMMLDFYVYTLLIVGFSYLSDTAFRFWSGSSNQIDSYWDNILYALCAYLLMREAIQARNEGMNWLIDLWNWLDMTNIVLVAMSVTLMRSDSESMTTRYVVMITGAIVWMMMLSFLRLTFLPFSVFVNGVINILWKLIPFLISSFIVLGAFVHLYYIDSLGTDRCRITVLNDEFGRRYEGEDSKFCTYSGTFIKIYSMFVGGIDEYLFTNGGIEERNWRIADHDFTYSTLWISVLFGLLVEIFLLNVIIVIVNESWDDVSRHGSEVFWENRLNVLLEVKSFANWRLPNFPMVSKTWRAANSLSSWRRFIRWMGSFVDVFYDFFLFETSVSGIDATNKHHSSDLFVHMLSSQHNGFAQKTWKCWKNASGKGFVFSLRKKIPLALKIICQIFVFFFLVAASFIGGLFTLGSLWPRSFRQFFFGSNEMHHNDVPGEMSREVRNLFKHNENYDAMMKESKKLHDMLHEKDAELSRINMQLLQQQRDRVEILQNESSTKSMVEDMKQQYEESLKLQRETSARLESKLNELMELMTIEKIYS